MGQVRRRPQTYPQESRMNNLNIESLLFPNHLKCPLDGTRKYWQAVSYRPGEIYYLTSFHGVSAAWNHQSHLRFRHRKSWIFFFLLLSMFYRSSWTMIQCYWLHKPRIHSSFTKVVFHRQSTGCLEFSPLKHQTFGGGKGDSSLE